MVGLSLLAARRKGPKDSGLTAAIADTAELLHSDDFEHLLLLDWPRGLARDPAPVIIVVKKFRSDVPRHAAEGAAVPLDVEVARRVPRVSVRWHVRLTYRITRGARSGPSGACES